MIVFMTDNLNTKKIKFIFVTFISNAIDTHYEKLLNETKNPDKSLERDLKYEIATGELTNFFADNSGLTKKDDLAIWERNFYGSFLHSYLKTEEDIEKIDKVVDNIAENLNELLDSELKDLREEAQGQLEHIDFNDYKKIIDKARQEFKQEFKIL